MEIKRDTGSSGNPDTIISISYYELKQLEAGQILHCRDEGREIFLKAAPPSSTANR